MSTAKTRAGTLWKYGLLTYLAMLANTAGYLWRITYPDAFTMLFAAVVYLTYGAFYLLPVFLPLWLLHGLFSWRPVTRLVKRPALRSGIVYGFGVLGFTALQILLFSDGFAYKLYGFHLNGFVWNLIFTKGGIESMGAGDSTVWVAVLLALGFLLLQSALLWAALKVQFLQRFYEAFFRRKRTVVLAALLFVAASLGERLTYAVSSMRNHAPVLAAAPAFPFYIPLTMHKLGRRLGLEVPRAKGLRIRTGHLRIRYPRKALERPHPKRYNIVWLACESLRADMLDREIMPATWKLAQRAVWFRNHFSGGNGTRMGMFSMFYGLYGSYWFPFLAENRDPVLMDLLLEDGYQLDIRTSAAFTSPEFDRTIFARIPAAQLHQDAKGKGKRRGWLRDRENVAALLAFLDQRDTKRPFFSFMFFESPHAQYYFPKESIIRKDYLEDFNYLTMDLKRDIGRIKNRYINACHHLDSQLQRVIAYLEAHQLLDSTILLITGDHGEEFMEHGRWGHGSDFSTEQTRVPLVLWAPGQAPRQVTRLTSHLDIPATILTRLGVTNPPEDYSLGFDLLGQQRREFSIIASWSNLVYIDAQYKAIFPTNSFELTRQKIFTSAYVPVTDTRPFYESRQKRLVRIMKEMKRFGR